MYEILLPAAPVRGQPRRRALGAKPETAGEPAGGGDGPPNGHDQQHHPRTRERQVPFLSFPLVRHFSSIGFGSFWVFRYFNIGGYLHPFGVSFSGQWWLPSARAHISAICISLLTPHSLVAIASLLLL